MVSRQARRSGFEPTGRAFLWGKRIDIYIDVPGVPGYRPEQGSGCVQADILGARVNSGENSAFVADGSGV